MDIVDKLIKEHRLYRDEYINLLDQWKDPEVAGPIQKEALRLRRKIYGNDVYVRGLIEFTNICCKDCYYCGIRKSNPEPERYRMKKEEVLECCDYGYKLGLRTFVLQGGEDGYYNDERLVEIVKSIKEKYPDCALTLSIGERTFDSYQMLKEAGADRYLLRHETADEDHYRRLHPPEMSLKTRMNCLYDLKSLGYQVGAGFMVGSPYQTNVCLAEDLVFLQDLQPEMVGIGPFIPHCDTSFSDEPCGSADLTLFLLSVIRIMLPHVLLPATTALASVDSGGREKAMLAGANVVMPNISPREYRGQYTLYDNKDGIGDDVAKRIEEFKVSLEAAGFHLVFDRGDFKPVSEDEDLSANNKKNFKGSKSSDNDKNGKKKKNKNRDEGKDDLTEEEKQILKEKKKKNKDKKKKKKKDKEAREKAEKDKAKKDKAEKEKAEKDKKKQKKKK